MISTGIVRVIIWLTITIAYVFRVPLVVHWFASVTFVAFLSILALVLTDWGQVAASLAQLTAGDAHHDAEEGRIEASTDYTAVENDIARLAKLHPGADATTLAADIRRRLRPASNV